MRDIKIIVCNNKIYFDNETITEIRELPDDSDYSTYKGELAIFETAINDGGFHNITDLLKTIDSLCTSYEGDRDSEYLSLDDDDELTEYAIEVLNEIRTLPEDSIFRKRLQEVESNNDIPTMNELVRIYDLVKAGVFTLETAEINIKKHKVVKYADNEVNNM